MADMILSNIFSKENHSNLVTTKTLVIKESVIFHHSILKDLCALKTFGFGFWYRVKKEGSPKKTAKF